MNISPVTTAPTGAPLIITPLGTAAVAAPTPTLAPAQLVAPTTVDLSPLGRFLSALTMFQKRLLDLQGNPSALVLERESEEVLAAVTGAAAALAEGANALQASSLNGTSDDQSLATLFERQFDAQTGADGDSANLAGIGLSFTAASGLGDGDPFSVDAAALQAAFISDPAATALLLGRTGAAFGALTGVTFGADPAALFADDAPASQFPLDTLPFESPNDSTAATGQQPLPAFADAPAPLASDDAFLQELLAETPRQALPQAPPAALTEANASFAAQQAAQADEPQQNGVVPNNAQAPAPPAVTQAPPATQERALAASTRPDDAETPAALPRGPQDAAGRASDTPPSAPAEALAPGALQANLRTQEAQATESAWQAQNAQTGRTLAGQALAAQDEKRDANTRLGDSIAAERDASERLGAALAAQRDAQEAQRLTQEGDDAATARNDLQTTDQRRLLQENAQVRLQQEQQQRELEPARLARAALADLPGAEDLAFGTALRDSMTPLAAALQQAPPPEPVVLPQTPPPLNNAQQLARDPAVAAAIAAYNLTAGPFAALNGRPEMAAPRPKVVPAVETVTKVTAIETDAATSESSRPFR